MTKSHPNKGKSWSKSGLTYGTKEYRDLWYKENKERLRDSQRETSQRIRESKVLLTLFQARRSSAKTKGTEFTIEFEELGAPTHCPVFNVPFVKKTPFAMSIDRIDNSKGYVSGNVQVISRLANTMKSNASLEELRSFAEWVLKNYQHWSQTSTDFSKTNMSVNLNVSKN